MERRYHLLRRPGAAMCSCPMPTRMPWLPLGGGALDNQTAACAALGLAPLENQRGQSSHNQLLINYSVKTKSLRASNVEPLLALPYAVTRTPGLRLVRFPGWPLTMIAVLEVTAITE